MCAVEGRVVGCGGGGVGETLVSPGTQLSELFSDARKARTLLCDIFLHLTLNRGRRETLNKASRANCIDLVEKLTMQD